MARSLAEVRLNIEDALRELACRIPIQAAFLFGSYAEGHADDDSDIDLAVFSSAVDRMSLEERIDLVSRVELAVRAPMEIHLFSERLLRDSTPADFAGFVRTTGVPQPVSFG